MPIWREDVLHALRQIGGIGPLSTIYDQVEAMRGKQLPRTWQAIVRRELEYNSKDSQSYQHKYDLFRSVNGIGGGVWALREVAPDKVEPPEKQLVTVNRIIRDTESVRRLKTLHGHKCQICTFILTADDGASYSEGHHVRPLGGDHRGLDTDDNILILCPNCHAACDLGFIRLNAEALTWRGQHHVSKDNIEYHNSVMARPLGPYV